MGICVALGFGSGRRHKLSSLSRFLPAPFLILPWG